MKHPVHHTAQQRHRCVVRTNTFQIAKKEDIHERRRTTLFISGLDVRTYACEQYITKIHLLLVQMRTECSYNVSIFAIAMKPNMLYTLSGALK